MSDWDNIGKGQTFTFAKNERKIQALAEGKDNADYYPDYTTTFQNEHTNNVKIPLDLVGNIEKSGGWCQMSIKINKETSEIKLNVKGKYESKNKQDKPLEAKPTEAKPSEDDSLEDKVPF